MPNPLSDPADGMVKLTTPEEIRMLPSVPIKGMFVPSGSWPIDTRTFNVVAWRLYDTLVLDPIFRRIYHFFQNHISLETGPQVTNLYISNALPQPEHFQVHRMWMLLSGDRSDAESFAPNASLALRIGQRVYSRVAVLDICRYGLDSVTLKDEPGPRCMDFKPPLMIEPHLYFSAELNCGGNWSKILKAQLILDGLMARAIQ